jgi:nucleotide-binding universal stress UspA family protein
VSVEVIAMKKILVATDGSEPAQVAVAWAGQFAKALRLKAVVAMVAEGSVTDEDARELRRTTASALEERWSKPLTEFGVDREVAVFEGDPRTALVAAATESDIDAVVVGTRGRGGFQGLGLGGVAHYLARHLRCPLIVVPGPGEALRGGAIVVGADGSPASEPALRWAVAVARDAGGYVSVVLVHSPLADVMTHSATNWQYRGEASVREQIARLCEGGVSIELTQAAGNPIEELLRVGAQERASLIAVGRRGWGGIHGLVLGRVPAQLLHHTDRPVAVIPH